ncbi:TRAP transporter small permease subunit [Desulfovibrio legallii]|jgi:TRAP-type mannitol/chloroaromatic compound transport system permease small subunit|uniref:TRAP-type mannitol/chloroaromatic compound transport system, small permease component n=1 Tax=Desulfovibrio legallii TaxID=571438 RepID=A0A1G7HRD8_9BACT|nr:TRAP transporter small permease subunit [Desulfovibrio legallii]SDF03097.1 TRAP-type mannitol/chloroaromatic compound transport system, small permease component [Desulfovibrio legallii]
MPSCIKLFVRYVDAVNRLVGRITLYLVFVMMGILLYSAASRYFFDNPVIWGVEMAQFCMVVYYVLGGGFALLINSHVRMDVFYGRWPWRKQARMDVFTSFFLIVYLGLLFYGCLSSTWYSIEFDQHNNSAWAPALAPIKTIMAVGIFLTLLQAFSEFFKAVARSRGLMIEENIPERLIVENGSLEPDPAEAKDAGFAAGMAAADLVPAALKNAR